MFFFPLDFSDCRISCPTSPKSQRCAPFNLKLPAPWLSSELQLFYPRSTCIKCKAQKKHLHIAYGCLPVVNPTQPPERMSAWVVNNFFMWIWLSQAWIWRVPKSQCLLVLQAAIYCIWFHSDLRWFLNDLYCYKHQCVCFSPPGRHIVLLLILLSNKTSLDSQLACEALFFSEKKSPLVSKIASNQTKSQEAAKKTYTPKKLTSLYTKDIHQIVEAGTVSEPSPIHFCWVKNPLL